MRKNPLVVGEIYHVFTKSIADFKILNDNADFKRMWRQIIYYKMKNNLKYSDFIELKIVQKEGFANACSIVSKNNEILVQIIAYCLMPTHIHFILKQLKKKGITKFMKDFLNSYTRYFNTKHKRKGPLWEGRFKSVLVESDEQLLHLTRYIHLNPTSASLTKNPEDWIYSSYREYLKNQRMGQICQFEDILEIDPKAYKEFVQDRISYQNELAKIKKLILES